MKIKYMIQAMLALLSVGGLTSCQNSFDDPGLVVPVAKNQANTTIAEFKNIFAEENMQLCPYKDEESKTPYIVKGRVISSDATGNIYQTLCIQDETSAMTFAIRRAALYDYYHVGQEIVVDLTGLWVGKYNYLLQIGWLNEDNYGDPSMGRVDFNVFRSHVELNGLPTSEVTYVTPTESKPAEGMYCIVENIDQLPSSPGESFYNLQGQLVEFRNVKFEGGGELPYAPYQESVNRFITQEGNSSKLTVRTSGYATFYNEILPEGTGTIRGILSYYASDPSYATTDGSVNGWQLLIRSLEDVDFNQKGQKDDPYTIAEAMENQNQSRQGWVKGYIVGSVKAGVTSVSSNSDIVFGADAELDNNLVIAASADETDWSKCMTVALPQGSALREYGNLVDNPVVYKKSIIVHGSLSSYLGLPGVQGTGASDSFEIDGVVIGGGTTPPVTGGDGTKEKPYSPEQIMASTADAADVWVEGYVVGYVPNMTWGEAVFGNTPDPNSTNYTNGTNFILSSQPVGSCSADNSIPVGLATSVRNDLAISKNPSIYGAKVKVKGSLEKYFGLRGIKQVSEFEIIEGGSGGGGNTPVNPPVEGQGDGTEANPFNVTYIQNSTEDASGVWVEGYIAGFIADKNWDSAVFGKEDTTGASTNFQNGTNCILSSVGASQASLSNSIPVAIPIGDLRSVLAVGKNPSIYGKKVLLKGNITKYFGQRGFKDVTEYKILD
ncbi:MAG: hypothetical protein K2L89_00180 [Muribaculaceae bacterium]|nr:hypothetical protein [Muribaculaceae bacterium]